MEGAVSVVSDFNDWQPGVKTLGGRGSIRSATVELALGRRYSFGYISLEGG